MRSLLSLFFERIKWMIRAKTVFKGDWFLCSRGIGDTMIFLSKLEIYKKNNPDKPTRIIISKTHESLIEGYKEFIDDYKTLSYKQMCKSTKIGFNNFLPNNIHYILPQGSFCFLGYKDINLSDLMNITLSLSEDTNIKGPLFKTDRVSIECEELLKTSHVAVLAPSAVSVKNNQNSIWRDVCKKLEAYGFKVLINSNCKIEGLENNYYINLQLRDAYNFIDRVELFVGLRNGMCDLIGFTKCQMIVVYPDGESKRKYSMEKMGFKKKIKEVYISQLVDSIDEYLKGKIYL